MRTLEALRKLVAKLTGKQVSAITGDTVDKVIDYAESNVKGYTELFETNGHAKVATEALTAYALVLHSPDESLWDISIANDGTISGTKRTE